MTSEFSHLEARRLTTLLEVELSAADIDEFCMGMQWEIEHADEHGAEHMDLARYVLYTISTSPGYYSMAKRVDEHTLRAREEVRQTNMPRTRCCTMM